MVGDGCAGPPKASICSNHKWHSAASASRAALRARSRTWTSADLRATDPVAKNPLSGWATHHARYYSDPCGCGQDHYNLRAGTPGTPLRPYRFNHVPWSAETVATIAFRREMERRHESHFGRFDPPSHGYPCPRCDTREAT